jgi:hypothetical protein
MPAHLHKFIQSVRSGRACSLETSAACKHTLESQLTSSPHCADLVDDITRASIHRVLFCSEVLRGVDNAWAKPADLAGV